MWSLWDREKLIILIDDSNKQLVHTLGIKERFGTGEFLVNLKTLPNDNIVCDHNKLLTLNKWIRHLAFMKYSLTSQFISVVLKLVFVQIKKVKNVFKSQIWNELCLTNNSNYFFSILENVQAFILFFIYLIQTSQSFFKFVLPKFKYIGFS
jgi:hypothetical protein